MNRMKRSIEDTPIVFIGAGNLATHLAKALYRKGFRIEQVYSRTELSASKLAEVVEATYTTQLAEVVKGAQLYIVALNDAAFLKLLPEMVLGRQHALWVHTAGSLPMYVWEGVTERYGVFYPLQTFSMRREVKFAEIPIFIEAHQAEDEIFLKKIAARLSKRVYETTSEERKWLHLAAVFSCNFTNHLYALTEKWLNKKELSFDVLLPLIDETVCKVHELSPRDAQTGPALRNDENIINTHLRMLADEPEMQELYRLLSDSIHRFSQS